MNHDLKIGDKVAINQNSQWISKRRPYLILEITGETKTQWRLENGISVNKRYLKVIGTEHTCAEVVTERILSYNAEVTLDLDIDVLKRQIVKAVEGVKKLDQLKNIYSDIEALQE